VFSSLLPFFALIGLGYFAGRGKLVSAEGVNGLNSFVLYFAMPALTLDVLTKLPIEQIFEWRFMASYGATSVSVFVVLVLFQRLVLKTDAKLASIRALCLAWANAVYLGLPIMLVLHGEKGLIIPMWTIIIDLMVTATLAMIFLEVAQSKTTSVIAILKKIARGLYTNLFFLSVVACFAIIILEIPIPGPIANLADFLADAAAPAALFAIGAGLATHKIEGSYSELAAFSLLKFALAPAAAAFFAYVVFDLPDWLAMSTVIISCLPVAGNCFLIAKRYNSGVATSSALILITTFISLPTLAAVLWWYGV